jgi:hypothetical protein
VEKKADRGCPHQFFGDFGMAGSGDYGGDVQRLRWSKKMEKVCVPTCSCQTTATAHQDLNLTMAEVGYALKDPPSPMPPINSPARTKSNAMYYVSNDEAQRVLSPNVRRLTLCFMHSQVHNTRNPSPSHHPPSPPPLSQCHQGRTSCLPSPHLRGWWHYSIPPGSSSMNT